MDKVHSIPGKFLRIAIAIILVLTAYVAAVPAFFAVEDAQVPPSDGGMQQTFAPVDVFDEFFSYVEAIPQDTNEDNLNDTVRILYDVETEGAKESVEVFLDVFNSSGGLIATYSNSFVVMRTVPWYQFFDYYAKYEDNFNFSLRLYDTTHNKKENYGNNYEIPAINLKPHKQGYEIYVTALTFDRDSDSFNDDVSVEVKDVYGFTLANVPVYIDGSLKGYTNENGTLSSANYERGYHEVDVFYHRNHANTDFKSEGDGVPDPFLVDCDPIDVDEDGVKNGVRITVIRENSVPVYNAEVHIDNVFRGNTRFDGTFYAGNFEEGFHYVNVKGFQQWVGSVFYSEPIRPIDDYNEFFEYAWAESSSYDGGGITNDARVHFNVNIEQETQSNVTVNATIMELNNTEIETKSTSFSITQRNEETHTLYFYNLSKDTYRIYLELFDDNWKLEDTWYIEEIAVKHMKMIVNVDRGVYTMDGFGSQNDIFFYSHVGDDAFNDGHIIIDRAGNGSEFANESIDVSGYNTYNNLPPGGYEWYVYDNNNVTIETGDFSIYPSVVITTQTMEFLGDDDGDEYYDDFRAWAYDEDGNAVSTVYVYIWDSDNNVFKEGYTSVLTDGGAGSFLVKSIPEGNYTYQARTTTIPQRIFTNGSFYSYGNETEESGFMNVKATVQDLDNDGNNDVVVKVTDFMDNPVPGARVYFDRDMTYYDTTDSNGEVTAYDFVYGWHDVDVYKVTGMPKGHTYTQFFSEGFDYDEFFYYAEALQRDADNDGETDDLMIVMDIGVNEAVEEIVTVAAYLFYKSNGTFYEKIVDTFLITPFEYEQNYMYVYDLPYNISFNATYRLYDQEGNFEDELMQDNIFIQNIGPEINVEFRYDGDSQISFFAHQGDIPIQNITINVYRSSDDSLHATGETRSNGQAYIYYTDDFESTEYYWTAQNQSGAFIENEGWFLSHQNLTWYEFQEDYDGDRFWDDFNMGLWWIESHFENNRSYQSMEWVNGTVDILDANKKLIMTNFTYNPGAIIYNLTEGDYYCRLLYDSVIYDFGEFHSYGNGFANQEPTVSIDDPADDSKYLDNEQISFDGSGSSDPDYYDRLTFEWTSDIDGVIGTQESFSAYLSESTHNITLSVDDAHGHMDTAWISLTIIPFAQPNSAPKAVISSPSENDNFYKSNEVYFDGANSTDEVPGNLTFEWSSDKDGTLGGNNSQFSSMLSEGTHAITLLVTDSGGLNSTDIVNVTVSNRAPVANISSPMNDAVYNASDDIQFDSAGSYDPDDDTLAFVWESNRSGIIGTSPMFTTKLSGGVHNINLTVSDGSLNSTVNVTLTIVNTPPEANITTPVEDMTYFKGPQFFDGSASVDLDGNVLYYYWELDNLPFMGNVSSFTKNVSELGPHTVMLFVTDGLVNVSDTVNFTIENQAPMADAGPDQKVNIGTEVTFNASLSLDLDGDSLTYAWDFDDSDGINQIDAEGMEVKHTYTNIPSDIRSFNVTLNVNDGSDQNNTARDNLTVNINRFPIADAGGDMKSSTGKLIYFNGSGSSDPDDDKLTYQWDFGDGGSDIGMNVSYVYTQAGNYTVSLNVSDGYAWDLDELEVEIIEPNTAPVANAGSDMTGNLNEDLTFNGSLSRDIDNDVLTFSWDFDASDGITEEALGMEVIHKYTTFGTFAVTLTVDDGRGGSDTDNLTVTINAPPTAVIAEVEDGYIGQRISFDASDSSDPENNLLTYRWNFGDDSPNVTGKTVNHVFADPDTYTVSLSVEDTFGATSTVSVEVEILPLPIPAITRPKNGDTVFDSIDIEGTASGDTVTHVQVYLQKQGSTSATLIDTVQVSAGKWSTTWDTKTVENGNYDLTARASDKDGKYRSEESSSIRLKIDNEESIIDDKPPVTPDDNATAEWWDPTALSTMCLALCLVVIVIIVIAIVAVVRRGRGARGKRPPAEALAAAQRDMYQRMEAEGGFAEEELGFEEITDDDEEEVEEEDEGLKRPVRCPSCGEIFISKDTGDRPWMLFCTQCGAKGIIKEERLKLPPGKEDEEEEKADEKKERKREKVRCPECEEIFSTWEDEKELECPNCGVTGLK